MTTSSSDEITHRSLPVSEDTQHEKDIANRLREPLIADNYHRIDEDLLQKHASALRTSAVHSSLNGANLISRYEIFQRENAHEIAAIVHIGDSLCGHPGIVHGGIVSALFDNTFGWLFVAMNQPPAFTANLNVNFRKPIMANSSAVIKAHVKEIQGRKIFISAVWEVDGHIHADASSLFIVPRPEHAPPKFDTN